MRICAGTSSDSRRHIAGRSAGADRQVPTNRLLALLNLENWCGVYLDGCGPGDVTKELKDGVAL